MFIPYCETEIIIPAHIQEQTKKIFESNITGKVIMVNSSGVYLLFEDRIVFINDSSWGIVPNGILVYDFDKFLRFILPEEGETVNSIDDKLIFKKGTIRLITDNVNVSESTGTPVINRIKQAAEEIVLLNKSNGISMLVKPLVMGEENSSTIHLNPYCEKAYPYFIRLIKALSENSKDEVKKCVHKLLGLGIGLTPSADDVILGMLYVFRKLRKAFPKPFNIFKSSVLKSCGIRTNRISSAYLKAIADGAYFERMEQVWKGLCEVMPLDVSKLTTVGSNSGAEMLLGMLTALRICGYDVNKLK